MADEPTTDPTADVDGAPAPDPDPDAGAKKALDEERKARREAERQMRDLQGQLKALTDKDKSEVEKLRDEVAQLARERDEHASKVMRAEVAMAKGLSAAQAKRLVGATKEELEADADEILEAFPVPPSGAGAAPAKPTPGQRPTADLRGGGDPTTEPVELDPRKLAERIPRS
jgi:hypothetical protein